MNCKNIFFILSICFALNACETTKEFSNELLMNEKNRITNFERHCGFSMYLKKKSLTAYGMECPSSDFGICLNNTNEMISDEEPICFAKNENGILSLDIPFYNNRQTVNPQFEMFDELDVLPITDSLILWDEEILEQLDFTTPIAITPNNYRVNRDCDTLHIDLRTCPVSLEKKVCVFFNYNDNVITSGRFQNYYDGFLGASDILTGIINEVDEECVTMTFLFEFNISNAQYNINHILDSHIFRISRDISCNDDSIYDILGFSEPFTLLFGDYDIEVIDGGFNVKIPFIPYH